MELLLQNCESSIHYEFSNKMLLKVALTHPSYNQGDTSLKDNQRLEFLGDSVLSMVISEKLYGDYPHANEGELTQKRSSLVCGATLVKIAKSIKLGDFILMSKAEENSGGLFRDSTLEDALEALVGAIYLDGGWRDVKYTILRWTENLFSEVGVNNLKINQKGKLQELVQSTGTSIRIHYNITGVVGPPHNRLFQAEVKINGKFYGKGSGKTKKEAESIAAQHAIVKFLETDSSMNLE